MWKKATHCVLPVLCVACFFMLLLNDGLAAQVYDHQTLLYMRSSVADLNVLMFSCHGLIFHSHYCPHQCTQMVFLPVVFNTEVPTDFRESEEEGLGFQVKLRLEARSHREMASISSDESSLGVSLYN